MKRPERLLPRVGERIQRYELIEEIGRGGFGVVFRAHQAGLGADVAVKVLIPPPGDDQQRQHLLERFEQEARLSKALEHPCALRVQDYGRTPQGLPFLVSEFVRGRTLDDVISAEALSTDRIIRIASQILGCLAEAHHQGIVHRDLKPSNIMLRDIYGERDVVKVLDFGIAKVSAELGGLDTQTGLALGTPYYMSPEQCRGWKGLDGRADLYALGLIIAECVARRRVVRATDSIAVLYAHSGPEALTFDPEVERTALFEVIQRSTHKDRDRRYPDAVAMRRALLAIPSAPSDELAIEAVAAGLPSGEQPPATPAQIDLERPATPSAIDEVSLQEMAELNTRSLTSGQARTATLEGLGTTRRKRARALWAALLLLAGAVVGGLLALPRLSDEPAPSDGEAGALVAPEEPEAQVGEQPEPERVQVAAPDPEGTVLERVDRGPAGLEEPEPAGLEGPAPSQEPQPATPQPPELAVPEPLAPAPRSVIARFVGQPETADVRLGGRRVCEALPCEVEIEAGEGSTRVRVSEEGWVAARIRVSREADRTYHVALDREPVAAEPVEPEPPEPEPVEPEPPEPEPPEPEPPEPEPPEPEPPEPSEPSLPQVPLDFD